MTEVSSDVRFLDRPAHPLRMRALCNALKQELLGDMHDPCDPQAKEIANHPRSPVDPASLWLSWWNGERYIQTKSREACERALPGVTRWLEGSHHGDPIQRHFAALDASASMAPKGASWRDEKLRRAAESKATCSDVWSLLIGEAPVSEDSSCHLKNQLAADESLPAPSFANASAEERMQFKLRGGNPYKYEFPASVRSTCSESKHCGLLRFLIAMAVHNGPRQSWWWRPWVFDLATLTALAQAEISAAIDLTPEEVLGHQDWATVATLDRVFWGPADEAKLVLEHFAPGLVSNDKGKLWQLILRHARWAYYRELLTLGIAFRDVRAVVRPPASKLVEHTPVQADQSGDGGGGR